MHARLWKDARGEFRWTLYAANNRKIADCGEGYNNKADCKAGLTFVLNITDLKFFNFYQDVVNQWRWNVKAQNGRILADSGEGYNNYADCHATAQTIVNSSASSVTVTDLAA